MKDYTYELHCDHDVTLGGHALYGRRHVVPSAFSLANSRCIRVTCEAGSLTISAGKASS